MFSPPLNNVVVQVTQKYTRNMSNLLKIAAIQQATTIEPADYVSIVGTVIALPMEISKKREYEGFTTRDIRVGDVAIFSSSVIYEFAQLEPDAEPIFKNSFWWNNQEYFNCDITRLYAVIRAGETRMQNGYVMIEQIEKQSSIYLPQHIKKKVTTTRGTLTAIGHPLTNAKLIDCLPGDSVCFNPNIITMHKIYSAQTDTWKEFGVIQQKHILGKVEAEPA